MKIIGYLYPQTKYNYSANRETNNQIYFTGGKTITSTFGAFSKTTQGKLENLHLNLKRIQELFLKFAHNPHRSAAIKDGYKNKDMVQKNRNSGISFKLPDNEGILTVRQLRANNKLLRFIVEKEGKTTNFLTDGFSKSVANLNEKNPQFLPRRFKYMLPDDIKKSNIEKYIEYADAEIQKYSEYLKKYNDPSVKPAVKTHKKSALKKANIEKTPEIVKEAKTEIKKSEINNIMTLFQKKPEELPPHIKPILSPSKSILGFNIQTDDGATLKVCKKINAKYGENMAYLSFEKYFPNGEKSYMSIDLQSYKFLRMKDAGKPLIRNHSVYEYNSDEIIKRNMVEKFESYANTILKTEKKSDIKPAPVQVQETNPTSAPPEIKPKEFIANNLDKLKENTVKRAAEDAKTLSDLYFKTFSEEFNKNIIQKLNDFKTNLDTFLQNLWKK